MNGKLRAIGKNLVNGRQKKSRRSALTSSTFCQGLWEARRPTRQGC